MSMACNPKKKKRRRRGLPKHSLRNNKQLLRAEPCRPPFDSLVTRSFRRVTYRFFSTEYHTPTVTWGTLHTPPRLCGPSVARSRQHHACGGLGGVRARPSITAAARNNLVHPISPFCHKGAK